MVEATDHGSPAQQTTATVIIKDLCLFSNEAFKMEMLIDIRVRLDCGPFFGRKDQCLLLSCAENFFVS